MKKIAIFASGSGSNAENICTYFVNEKKARVALILCNNPKADVFKKAERLNIPHVLIHKNDFYSSNSVLEVLKLHAIDFIVLAGFLWLVPDAILRAFPKKILNIHPALLPDFGGAGMYGMNVHKAVLDSGKMESGISIHFVDEQYDQGQIVFQKKIALEQNETLLSLAEKIQALEHRYYPHVIEGCLT